MKLKKRLKGVSDIRTHAPGAPRDPLPMMRAYQQAAIDESRIRAATVPPTKAVVPAKPVKSMPIRYAFGGADDSPETRHWIEVAGKRYFCDEIDEAAAMDHRRHGIRRLTIAESTLALAMLYARNLRRRPGLVFNLLAPARWPSRIRGWREHFAKR